MFDYYKGVVAVLIFSNIKHVKTKDEEFFYGCACCGDIKMRVMYDFKTKEAVGHGGQKLPHDLWAPVRGELQQYFRNLEQEYKSLHNN